MSTRQQKVQELLKQEISDIFLREFKDPRLGFVTITDAEVSSDMRHARIFISVMGSDDVRKRNLKVLNNASHFIRSALSKRMSMKTIPDLEFRIDESIDQGIRMLELLEKIKSEEKQ